MILMYIAREKYSKKLLSFFRSRGIVPVHYSNPLKAMDNFTEIDPDIVLFRQEDFPRHWKISLKELRELKNKEESVFILLTEGEPDNETCEDGLFLGYNGTVPIDKTQEKSLDHIIFKYKTPEISLARELYYPEKGEMSFAFLNPYNFQFISGYISEIWNNGAFFVPDNSSDIEGINEGMKFENCSVSINETLTEVDCLAESVGKGIKLIFINQSEKKMFKLHPLFA